MARITVQLKSGGSVEIAPLAMHHAGMAARRRICEAAPSSDISDRLLEDVFAPALMALDDAEPGRLPLSCDIVKIGPPTNHTGASVIIPLTGDRGIITTWTAAIAAGIIDGFTNELIFVQPAAGEPDLAERALGNLFRQTGIGAKLIGFGDPAARHDQLNACAEAASRDRLVFLGESCFPHGNNSLTTLLSVFEDAGRPTLAGGAVLDPNGSIIHAGYLPPKDGRIASAFAGFPAIELLRNARRNVFACSSEFFALDRTAFENIGGFSATYLTSGWGDADFSRRICASGGSLGFEHRARAIRFLATGQAPQFDENLARRIDAWRFVNDWPDDAAQWSDAARRADAAKTGQSDIHAEDGPRMRAGNARWAA